MWCRLRQQARKTVGRVSPDQMFGPIARARGAGWGRAPHLLRRLCGTSSSVIEVNCASQPGANHHTLRPRVKARCGRDDSLVCLPLSASKRSPSNCTCRSALSPTKPRTSSFTDFNRSADDGSGVKPRTPEKRLPLGLSLMGGLLALRPVESVAVDAIKARDKNVFAQFDAGMPTWRRTVRTTETVQSMHVDLVRTSADGGE